MSKTSKNAEQINPENEAFEMIELALSDLETLTRAFNLISEVCEEGNRSARISVEAPPKNLVN